MLKKFLPIVFMLVSLTAWSQNADERIGTLIGESRWFELEDELKSTPADSISPLLRQMASAITHHYFNRPDSACMLIADLLNNHQQELGDNTLSMAILLGINLARTDRYAEAASLMQDLCNQLTAQGVDSTQINGYRLLAVQYKAYAKNSPVCKPIHPKNTYRIPMVIKDENGQHSILMNGIINRRESELIFDTGAGINIISPKQASDHNLKLLDAYMPMQGIGKQYGQYALADTMRIGDMTWINVPFFVVDIQAGHTKADSILKQLPPVIGLPVMLSMQEIQMDFTNHEFIIPSSPTPNPMNRSNLLRTDSENLRIASTDKDDNPLLFHFDTGGYYTQLTPKWYAGHKAEIDTTGSLDSIRIAGVGGISITRAYKMPKMTFRIGRGTADLDSVMVDTGIDLYTGNQKMTEYLNGNEDGTIGLDLLERFTQVTLNFKDMYLDAIPRRKE